MGEKKRVYNAFSGKRKDSSECFGETVDHNVQVNDLPDVGQYVVINELRVMGRSYRDRTGIYSIYVYDDAYMDYWGNPIVYRVEGYTKGQENPLDPTNKVMLESVSENGKLVRRTQIKTVRIATGALELEIVDPDELSEVGFREYDGVNLISEDARVVEKYISQGRIERVCRQNKHV